MLGRTIAGLSACIVITLISYVTEVEGKDIIVTAGPISQTYEALGEVKANTADPVVQTKVGREMVARHGVFSGQKIREAYTSPETLNKLLREQALTKYGSRVDAVVNVAYSPDGRGFMSASGLAVQFIEPAPVPTPTAPTPSLEDRLRELLELLDLRQKGLITPEEYDEKRQEILGEL